MVQINEAMLRGRAEHNDRCLSNLKEISLHQQNIEGINRMLTRMCPELEILYLQHNLIPKIENLKRLRDLDYLNLALNNIKKIEGLDRNEKLRKLDLTVNFIDIENLLSVESLRVNHNLRELFLIGNPCTEFQSYRLYVIGTLPQLEKLDGHAITATERIQAEQQLRDIRVRLVAAARERVKQMGGDPNLVDAEQVPDQEIDSDEEGKELYGFSPEIRLADYKREVKKKQREDEEKKTMEREKDPMKAAKEDYYKNRSLMKEDGTPRVCNDGKWNFDINDDKEGNIVVRIEVAQCAFLLSTCPCFPLPHPPCILLVPLPSPLPFSPLSLPPFLPPSLSPSLPLPRSPSSPSACSVRRLCLCSFPSSWTRPCSTWTFSQPSSE
mmetsp:Transcript_42701/g.134544  ORF Transcript_42701/g.134544 Transcript_42701/m.134544 type:complete len:382 (-) Transcript_42701:1358-2503(-)